MNEKIVARMLKPFGLYKINNQYLKPENEQLKKIGSVLNTIARIANSRPQVIAALKAGDEKKAVERALKICKIDEVCARVKDIQRRVEGGDDLKEAVAFLGGPGLVDEMVALVRREIAAGYDRMTQLQMDISVVVEKINRKVANLESAAEDWSLGEKMGTPEAVRGTLKKAEGVQKSARQMEEKLEALLQSVDEMRP